MSGMFVSVNDLQSISQMALQTSQKEQTSKGAQLVEIGQAGKNSDRSSKETALSRQFDMKLSAIPDKMTTPLENTALKKATADGIMSRSFDILA